MTLNSYIFFNRIKQYMKKLFVFFLFFSTITVFAQESVFHVGKSKDGKIIVFTQFRDSAVKIEKTIQSIPNVAASIFVGQTKKDDIGMSQKKQIGVLKDFKL